MTVTRIRAILAIVAFGIQSSLFAQQLSLFTQYRENATILNPAALESDFFSFGQNFTIGASYRSQWVGISGNPRTQTLRLNYLNKDMTGVALMFGGHLINDQTGPTGFTGAYGRIAGVLSGDVEYNGFVIGLSAGAVQYRVNASKIILRDPNDDLGTQNKSQFYPDLGLGIFFYQTLNGGMFDNDYVYAGISIPQVFGLDLTFQTEDGEFTTKRVQHIYGNFGLYKFFNNDSFLEPSVWVKYAPGAPINADLNVRYHLPTSFWVGTGASLAGTAHLEAGFEIGSGQENTVRIGYGFDYSFNSFGPTAGSTHEINIAIAFDR